MSNKAKHYVQNNLTPQVQSTLDEISHICSTIGTTYSEEDYLNNSNLLGDNESLFYKLLKAIQQLRKLQPKQQKSFKSTEAKFKDFFEWLKQNGLDVSTLPIEVKVDDAEKGNGMFAKVDIKKGDNLIEIPRSLMITTLTADELKVNEIRASYIHQLPSVKLSVHLWLEKIKNNSFWKPYIDTLPSTFHLPFHWTIDELHALRGSFVQSLALKLIHTTTLQYLGILNALMLSGRKEAPQFTYDEYIWAVSVVMSRQNVIPVNEIQEFALIPLWDLFNHSEDDTTITTFYYPETDSMVSAAMSDYAAGNEVFIYYGSRPNSMLLLYSGFRFSNNSNDSVACYHQLIKENDPYATLKKLFLTKHQIHNSQILFRKSEDIKESRVFVSARIAVASIDDIKILNTFENPVGKEASLSNELLACDYLLELCQVMLIRSGGATPLYTLDDLNKPNLPYHMKLAIGQVIDERNIVFLSIEKLNDLKSKLKKRQQNRKKKQKKKPSVVPSSTPTPTPATSINNNKNNNNNNNNDGSGKSDTIGENGEEDENLSMLEQLEQQNNVNELIEAADSILLD